jgi:ribosomal protein L5
MSHLGTPTSLLPSVVAEDFILISNYNIMELPNFLRVVVNTASKEYLDEKKQSTNALAACFLLSGQ